LIDEGPQVLQDIGSYTSYVGYGLTLSVIGSEVGIPMSKIGNGISLLGTSWEAYNKFSSGDVQGGILDAGSIGAGALVDYGISRVPGGSLSKELLKQNAAIKLDFIKSYIEKQ